MENKNQKGEQGRKRKRKMSKEKKAKRRRQWRANKEKRRKEQAEEEEKRRQEQIEKGERKKKIDEEIEKTSKKKMAEDIKLGEKTFKICGKCHGLFSRGEWIVHGKLRNCEEKGLSRHEIVKAKQKRREKAEKEQQEQTVTQEPWIRKRTTPEIFKPKKKL